MWNEKWDWLYTKDENHLHFREMQIRMSNEEKRKSVADSKEWDRILKIMMKGMGHLLTGVFTKLHVQTATQSRDSPAIEKNGTGNNKDRSQRKDRRRPPKAGVANLLQDE